MAADNFIDCKNTSLTDEQLASMLITKDDDGNFAIRAKFVDAGDDDAINCDNSSMTLSQMLRNCIGLDENLKPAVRLANKKAAAINNLGEYANDGAAQADGVGIGEAYWHTGDENVHVRMS